MWKVWESHVNCMRIHVVPVRLPAWPGKALRSPTWILYVATWPIEAAASVRAGDVASVRGEAAASMESAVSTYVKRMRNLCETYEKQLGNRTKAPWNRICSVRVSTDFGHGWAGIGFWGFWYVNSMRNVCESYENYLGKRTAPRTRLDAIKIQARFCPIGFWQKPG